MCSSIGSNTFSLIDCVLFSNLIYHYLTHKTSLIPPPFIEVSVPSQECERSCIYVLGVSIVFSRPFCHWIFELFRQSAIFELFRQSAIFELFRQSAIFELFRQSAIFELFRQSAIFELF